jgi:lambda family phage tail tape measure protein
MQKNGDATKGAAEFNKGQKELAATLEQSRKAQADADAAFDLGYAKKSLALQRSIDDQVNAIGMGTKEAKQTAEVTKAYQDEADALAELALKRQEGNLTQDQYDHDVQTVKDATNKNVAAMQDGFKRIDAAQGNWLNGAKTAMKDYADAG